MGSSGGEGDVGDHGEEVADESPHQGGTGRRIRTATAAITSRAAELPTKRWVNQ